jgi:3-dehydrosphinganine reductase
VTGGSLGIGKSFAIQAAKKGADVTIVARSIENLELALTEVKANALDLVNQKIQYLSCKYYHQYIATVFISKSEKNPLNT